MNSLEKVTDVWLRRDHWITPVGTFSYKAQADKACKLNDLDPVICIRHEIEMAQVADIVKAIDAYCKQFAIESLDYVAASSEVKYLNQSLRVPEKYFHNIAYAVEGSSEGYYVHFGVILQREKPGEKQNYMDYGFAKLYSREEASKLATEIQRFLTAAEWN